MFAVQPLFPHGVPMFAVQPLFPHYSSTPGTSSREQKEKEVFWQGEYLCLLFNLYFLIILPHLGPHPGNKIVKTKEKEALLQVEYLCLLFNLNFLIILFHRPGKQNYFVAGVVFKFAVHYSILIFSLSYPTWDLIQGIKLS